MKSFSEIQGERLSVDLATRRLAGNPALQAAKIAHFIVSHAQLAEQILKLQEEQRRLGHDATSEIVNTMAEYIKRNALHDLGIRLEWDQKDLGTR